MAQSTGNTNIIRASTLLSSTTSFVQGNSVLFAGNNAAFFNVSVSVGTGAPTIYCKVQVSDDNVSWYDLTIRDTTTNSTITATSQLRANDYAEVHSWAQTGNYSFKVWPISAAWITAAFSTNANVTTGATGCTVRVARV